MAANLPPSDQKLSTGGSGFEIDGSDVVKLVLQFLHEQGLVKAARELQTESGVALNTVDNRDHFVADVRHGRWEIILPAVGRMKLPSSLVTALYEQVVLELLECSEYDLAREMLRTSAPLQLLRTQDSDRFILLDGLCGRKAFDITAAYGVEGAKGKEKRRLALADRISQHISVVPPSRLLSLVGQALKYQQHNGLLPKTGQFDLFSGLQRQLQTAIADTEEKPVKKLAGQIRFGSQSHCEVACYTPDGTSVVTASADGFIEVWDLDTCKLRRDLPYQAVPDDERFMMHDKPIHALCFSRDGSALASGDTEGKVKVWRLSTGKRIKLFERAHLSAVSSLCFSTDGSQVLSGGFDDTARIHGLKSGKMLKEFRGHDSIVKAVSFVDNDAKVVTVSDSTVRVFESRSCECLGSFKPGNSDLALHTIISLPDRVCSAMSSGTQSGHAPLLLAVGRGPEAWVVTLQGVTVRCFTSGTASPFVTGCISSSGKMCYLATEDGQVYCFDMLITGSTTSDGNQVGECFTALEKDVSAAAEGQSNKKARVGGEILGLAHHPHRNLLASFANDGLLKLWRP